jgi:2-C-methyl-D-erythritol 4-phosphate cytidylyltransferase
MSKVTAIILAAGHGTRMGPNVDKLFLELCGKPIIAHTWSVFEASPEIGEIVLVVRDGMQSDFQELAATYGFKKSFRFAPGGAERQNSVWNGLLSVSAETELVAIQDGARPCTTPRIIADCVAAARETGAAVAAQRVTDTLKEGNADAIVTRHMDRSKLWSVQTPQVFRTEIIKRALDEVFKRGAVITDDTAACEFIGQPVKLVESATPNPKATAPGDLPFIELVMKRLTDARDQNRA